MEIIKQMGRDDIEATSAGTNVYIQTGASYNSILTMGEHNVDISTHTSKPVTSGLIDWADRVYCMTRAQAGLLKKMYPQFEHKVKTLSEADVYDPFGGSLDDYKTCCAQITDSVKKILEEI
jgi:protein-tyrosine-phosphatase